MLSSTRALWRSVKGGDAVLTPGDMSGIKFRVPGSKMLQQYYRMVGANPTPVAWGETPSAIKQGVADALDPSVGALFVFGFKDILSHVTFTQAVPDSQVYSMNLEWFNSLPADVQEGIEWAGEMTSAPEPVQSPVGPHLRHGRTAPRQGSSSTRLSDGSTGRMAGRWRLSAVRMG